MTAEGNGGEFVQTGHGHSRRRRRRVKASPCGSSELYEDSLSSVEEIDALVKAAMEKMAQSDMFAFLKKKLADFAGENSENMFHILGNGHFGSSHLPGLEQLALIILLASDSPNSRIVYRELAITESESSWLKSRNIDVRSAEDMNHKEHWIEDNSTSLHIVVLIHGEHMLFNSALWTNWTRLHRFAFITNDYGKYPIESTLGRVAGEFEAIQVYSKVAHFESLPEHSRKPTFFSHSAFITLPTTVQLLTISRETPTYTEFKARFGH